MKKKLRSAIFILLIFLLYDFPGIIPQLEAQTQEGVRNNNKYPPAKNYVVQKAASKIKIDGILNEEAWKYPEKIKLPYEWQPGDNIPAPVESECLITFDNSRLYVAFRCFDPEPRKIRAHLMDRDSIDTFIQDDHIGFMIDTFNDERRAFEFLVNPLGVQVDGIFSEMEGYEDYSWDAIWESAGKITDFGYVIELAIPFNQLRFPKGKGVQTWGFIADRSYPRSVRHRMASHISDRNLSCLLCQFNKMTGFEGISPGRNIELDSTLTGLRTDNRVDFPDGEMEKGKIKVEPGITTRWGISPNLMLNATVNPDFSQVEADVAQLDVNIRFALRYPEKRPFFLEGADFFLSPIEAVFTRTVYEPIWGGKMSGKMGKNAIGLFVTQDRYNNLIFPANQGSSRTFLEEDVFGGVLRYRRDVGKGSTMGILYTGRAGDDYYNHVAGLDGFFRLSRTKIITLQYLYSRTDYPETVAQNYNQEVGAFDGSALFAKFVHSARNVYYYFTYEDFAADFRSDFGFIPRVDTRRIEAGINPVLWGKEGQWFDRLACLIRGVNITNHENTLTDRIIELSASYTGPLQTYTYISLLLQKEFFNGITYDKNQMEYYLVMKPLRGLSFIFLGNIGDSIDYSNSRPAQSLFLTSALELGIGKHLNVNINHTFQRLFFEGEKIYTANLLQTKLVYNFNVRAFVRAIVQYVDIDRNPDLYLGQVDSKTKTLFTQLLFSYKINPRTVLFLGYSDNHLGYNGIDITRTDRTFFLKIGYALVL